MPRDPNNSDRDYSTPTSLPKEESSESSIPGNIEIRENSSMPENLNIPEEREHQGLAEKFEKK